MTGSAAAFKIRRGKLRDLRTIRRLVDTVYDPLNESIGIPDEYPQPKFWWLILDRRLWVLEDQKELVGLIGLQDNSVQLVVFLLTVRPDTQRRGIGRALIAFAEAEARKRGLIGLLLHTPEKLTNAIEFYQRLGFSDVGRENFYGHTFVIFAKRLDATAPPRAAASALRP
jgi:ribosomal protein S18 acetylase RimI-like enzyme